MKTITIDFPVLEAQDANELLDVVTRVDGVVAALVSGARLTVMVASDASALLVKEGVFQALAAHAVVVTV